MPERTYDCRQPRCWGCAELRALGRLCPQELVGREAEALRAARTVLAQPVLCATAVKELGYLLNNLDYRHERMAPALPFGTTGPVVRVIYHLVAGLHHLLVARDLGRQHHTPLHAEYPRELVLDARRLIEILLTFLNEDFPTEPAVAAIDTGVTDGAPAHLNTTEISAYVRETLGKVIALTPRENHDMRTCPCPLCTEIRDGRFTGPDEGGLS